MNLYFVIRGILMDVYFVNNIIIGCERNSVKSQGAAESLLVMIIINTVEI